jgi:hypothetical protein
MFVYSLCRLDGLSSPHPATARHGSHWVVIYWLGDLSPLLAEAARCSALCKSSLLLYFFPLLTEAARYGSLCEYSFLLSRHVAAA